MKRILLFLSSFIIAIGTVAAIWLGVFASELQQTHLRALFGNAQAQFGMGVAYDTGAGVEANVMKAKHWYKKAAAQGIEQATVNLGLMLVKSTAEEDKKAALAYFRRAAEAGNTDAMVNVARCAFLGAGMEKDEKEGAMWMKKAAEKGVRDAQGMTGVLYLGGIGVEQDMQEGLNWLKKANTASTLVAQIEAGLAPLEDLPPEAREEQMTATKEKIRADIRAHFTNIIMTDPAKRQAQ